MTESVAGDGSPLTLDGDRVHETPEVPPAPLAGEAPDGGVAPATPEETVPSDAPVVTEPSAPAPRTVGRLIADALRSAGVRYAFTVPGESFLGLLDALGDAGIRVITTRHEGAAAFMAEAHGQLTGRPAACLATRAVGAANLAIGIHTARQDSTPMFALVGQVDRAHQGHEAFQEIDQVATIGGLAKFAVEPRDAAAVGPAMAEAIRQALGGRPGPVLISLPEDLAARLVMAAELHSATVLKSCLQEVEKTGPAGERLARHLRGFLASYDMKTIQRLVAQIPVV